jgi:hypothetical protein
VPFAYNWLDLEFNEVHQTFDATGFHREYDV